MQGTTFKHTNKQYFLGCMKWFFTGLFFIAFVYIMFNIGDFWETHAFETIFIIFLAGFTIRQFFSGGIGREMNSDIYLSDKSVIVGGKLRMPIEDLELVEYQREGANTLYLLHNKARSFVLYTSTRDEFINHLLESRVAIQRYQYSDYSFSQNNVVWVGAEGGRELSINLDKGDYKMLNDGEVQEYKPDKFIITPNYVKKQKK